MIESFLQEGTVLFALDANGEIVEPVRERMSVTRKTEPEMPAAQTAIRHRGESGRPSGNNRNTSAIGTRMTKNSQSDANPKKSAAGNEPGERNRPRIAYFWENGRAAKASAMRQNSHPIGFEAWRRAMSPPTDENERAATAKTPYRLAVLMSIVERFMTVSVSPPRSRASVSPHETKMARLAVRGEITPRLWSRRRRQGRALASTLRGKRPPRCAAVLAAAYSIYRGMGFVEVCRYISRAA